MTHLNNLISVNVWLLVIQTFLYKIKLIVPMGY